MRKKSLNQRMVRKMDDEIRNLGYCAECGSKITDEMDEYFYDDEGNFFCNCDCAMEYSGIHRLEI